jgi:hypothetical protein
LVQPPPPVEPELVTPAWVREPLSWEKLELIERWLETESARHQPELVAEAELQLNEGRIYFSRRDLESKSVPRDTLKVRAENAKVGFEKLLANPVASAGQRNRAQIGLRAANALLSAPGAQAFAPISRSQWGARAPRGNMTPLKGTWSRITVHHSAEGTSDPKGGSFEDSAETLRLIQKFHMDDPGHRWGDIGYHFLVDGAGRIFEGRELRWQGAHAGGVDGANNFQNIGVCLLGDLERRPPTPAALKSLQVLLDHLRETYSVPRARVYPHSWFKDTRCPGPALTAWLKEYAD